MRFPLRLGVRGPILAAVMALAVAPALAQDVTVYDNQTDYDAAAGASDYCIDFNGSTGALVSGSSFSGDVTFGSPEASDATQVNWNSDAISDAGSTTDAFGVGPLDGTFTGTAMAFRFVLSSAANAPTVDLYAADSSLIATVNAPSGSGFFGVVTTVPVKRFVVNNGLFGDGTRDRFFIDDFCATAEVGGGGGTPPADLAAMCADLDAAVAAADASAFRNAHRRKALLNKLRVVCNRIDAGDVESLCAALRKLQHDVLPKTDGEAHPQDWIVDATVQQDLEDRINALIAGLEDAIEALGGCPSDDDGDDGGEDGGGGGASANGVSHGRGHAK